MILRRDFTEQDQQLKLLARTPREQKPLYDWASLTKAQALPATNDRKIFIDQGDQAREFEISEIAEKIGHAMTDLMLSQKEAEIFSDKNQAFVAHITRAVIEQLHEHLLLNQNEEHHPALSEDELDTLIEKTLERHNAHDLARSFLTRKAHRQESALIKSAHPSSGIPNQTLVTAKVIRRNGQVTPWNQSKIEIACRKAFLSLELDSSPAVGVAEAVTQRIVSQGVQLIHIEDLQDIVQEEMMRQGHYRAATAYILYRSHRAEARRELESAEASAHVEEEDQNQGIFLLVKQPDGSTIFWDGIDLRRRIEFAMLGLDLELSKDQIEVSLRRSLSGETTREMLRSTIILNAKDLIPLDADFAKFAGRILLTYIYEEVLDWDIVRDGIEMLPLAHRKGFKRNLARAIEIERLSPRLLDFDLDKLADALDPVADLDFEYLGIQTLYDRYLIVDKTIQPHTRLESPQLFWMRVAMGLHVGELDKRDVTDRVISLYRLYKSRRFCSSTPTLFNSGTLHSQLSSCYLYKVDDSIESIMYRGIAENAFLSKWAGGLGGSWTQVRGTGGYIKGTNGESQGVIPFLKLHNDQLVAVNQGGKRKGSGCAYLEIWHNDIFDFLKLRVNTGDERLRTHDLNTANWIPDLFMKRMEARQHWTLFRSNETPDLHEIYGKAFEERYVAYEAMAERGEIFGKRIQAIDLWKEMLKSIFETGHPWITFKDPCNVRSPQDHVGVVHSSNLCTEITLNTSDKETAVCNLGSIILDSHLTPEGKLDLPKLRETVRTAVRALDNVIDINFYPTEAARRSNIAHRPIGLGVMGLQNALYHKGIAFDSDEAVNFNDEFMEAIAWFAYEASSDLATERGSYSSFKGSKWDRGLLPPDTLDLLEQERGVPVDVPRGGKMDWEALRTKIQAQGMRNSNVLAIAPTATISNIMGSSPCIEPTFRNYFSKNNLSGSFAMLNNFLVRDLKKIGLWNDHIREQLNQHNGELNAILEIPEHIRRKYPTAFQIPHDYIINAAARRQKWIDQAQSVNLFCESPEMKILSHMYRLAWRTGLKTTYYLRTVAASNIEKQGTKANKELTGVIATTVKESSAEEQPKACSIEAMLRGEVCESCQ